MSEILDVLFKLSFDTGEGATQAKQLIDDIKRLETEQGKAEKGSKEFATATGQLAQKQKELGQVLNKEATTIDGLRTKQQLLQNVVNQSKIGSQQYIQAQQKLIITETQLTRVTGQLAASQQKVGQSTQQLGKKFSDISGMLKQGLGMLGIASATAILGNELRKGIGTIIQFEKSISNLSAITGAVGQDLKFLEDAALRIGSSTTTGAAEAAEAFKLIASARPELLKNKEALVEVTEAAVTLAEASGITLPEAGAALAETLNQMAIPTKEVGRVINVLAAAAQLGAKEIPFINDALTKFGGVAASAGVSIEESVAAIETLGEVIPQAEIAGRNMRGILIDLQKTAAAEGREFKGLSGELELLAPKVNDVTFLTKKFGDENLLAVQTLIKGRKRLDELTKGITGTNSAYAQAKINTTNLDGALKKLNNAYEGLILSFREGGGELTDVVEFFTELLNQSKPLQDAIKGHIKLFTDFFGVFVDIGKALGVFNEKSEAASGIMKAWGLVIKVLSAPLRGFVFILKFFADHVVIPVIIGIKEFTKRLEFLQPVLNRVGQGISFVGRKLGLFSDEVKEVKKETTSMAHGISAAFKSINDASGEIIDTVKTEKQLNALERLKKKVEELQKKLELQIFTGKEYSKTLERLRIATRILSDTQDEYNLALESLESVQSMSARGADDIIKKYDDQQEALLNLKKALKELAEEDEDRRNANTLKNINNQIAAIDIELSLRKNSFRQKIDLINEEAEFKQAALREEHARGLISERQFSAEILKIEQDREDKIRAMRQERFDKIISITEESKGLALGAASDLIEANQTINDSAIEDAQRKIDDIKKIADKGNAEQLQAEEERLAKLQAQRAKFVRAQQALATVEIIANSLIAISKAAAQGGIAAIITIPLTIAALIAGLALARAKAQAASGFEAGEVDIQPHTRSKRGSTDTIPAWIAPGETVTSAARTQKYKPILKAIQRESIRPDILNSFADSRYIPFSEFVSQYKVISDYSGLEKKVDQLINIMSELPGKMPTPEKWGVNGNEFTKLVTNNQKVNNYIKSSKR